MIYFTDFCDVLPALLEGEDEEFKIYLQKLAISASQDRITTATRITQPKGFVATGKALFSLWKHPESG